MHKYIEKIIIWHLSSTCSIIFLLILISYDKESYLCNVNIIKNEYTICRPSLNIFYSYEISDGSYELNDINPSLIYLKYVSMLSNPYSIIFPYTIIYRTI